MFKSDVINFYGTKAKVAKAAGVDPSAVSQWQELLHGGNWFLKVARCVYRRHLAASFCMIPRFMTNIVRRSGRGG